MEIHSGLPSPVPLAGSVRQAVLSAPSSVGGYLGGLGMPPGGMSMAPAGALAAALVQVPHSHPQFHFPHHPQLPLFSATLILGDLL